MSSADVENSAAGKLIERLLVDPEFRAEFRRDPPAACTAAGLPDLAAVLAGSSKSMDTLAVRESRSSLAGVVMAVAVEGMSVGEAHALMQHGLSGVPRGAGSLLHGRVPHSPLGHVRHADTPAALERALGRGRAGGGTNGSVAGGGRGSVTGGAGAPAPAAGGGGSVAGAVGGGGSVAGAVGGGGSVAGAVGGGGSVAGAVGGGGSVAGAVGGGGSVAGAVGGGGSVAGAVGGGGSVAGAGGGPGAGAGGAGAVAPAEHAPAAAPVAPSAAPAPPDPGAQPAHGGVTPVWPDQPSGSAGETAGAGTAAGTGAGMVAEGAGAGGTGADANALVGLLQSPRLSAPANVRAFLTAGGADPRMVSVLSSALANHTIGLGQVEAVSDPAHVQAVDIVSVDGQPVGADNLAARDLVTEIAALDQSVRPSEIGTPWPIRSPGFFSDAGAMARLHLAFEAPGTNTPSAGAGAYPASARGQVPGGQATAGQAAAGQAAAAGSRGAGSRGAGGRGHPRHVAAGGVPVVVCGRAGAGGPVVIRRPGAGRGLDAGFGG